MKILCFILFFFLIACSGKGNNSPKASSRVKNDYVSQIKGTTPSSINLFVDTVNMERYQTFDEYSMSGKGRCVNTPFVYVKKNKDSIIVFSSNKNDSIRIYVKMDNGVWYNHMEFDMWKKNHFVPSKNEFSKIARTYDRYFFNDTILELKTGYISEKTYHQLFIKNKNHLYCIRDFDYLCHSNIEDLRKIAYSLTLHDEKLVSKYVLIERKDQYIYKGENNSFSYKRKAYGYWGIQPGMEENNLHANIDIREYSDNLKRYQRNNPDYIYEEADVIPKFPGGTSKFFEFVKNNRDSSLLLDTNTPNRVIVEVIIEKNGCITNTRIVKSIDSSHDNDALNLVKKMPNWSPAKLNGNSIRYRMLIPISYKR
jgi:hypothetical protein